MDTPFTMGGIIAAVVIPLVGVLVWVVKHILERTIPDLTRQHHDTLDNITHVFAEQLRETREAYRIEMTREREAFQADQREIIQELRRVSSMLQAHEDLLTRVLHHLRIQNHSDNVTIS